MKPHSLKKIVNRLRLCILAFILTMLGLILFSFRARDSNPSLNMQSAIEINHH